MSMIHMKCQDIFYENKNTIKLLSAAVVIGALRPNVSCTCFLEIFGPHHAKMCLWAYADSEGPDQPAHL